METQTPEAATAKNVAIWEDFIDIFISPREVFARRRDGRFVAAMIILAVALAILTVPAQMSMTGVIEAELLDRMDAAETTEFSQEQVRQIARFSPLGAAVGILFVTPVAILMTGLVLWAATRVVGATMLLAQTVMVATYAAVPKLLAVIVTMAQALVLDPTRAEQVATSPVRFLGEGATPVLASILARFDLFLLWGVVLIAIGVSTVAGVSRSRGWIAAGITWLVALIPAIVTGLILSARG